MELEVVGQKNDRTDVGSYFVANYPPFSAWSREHVPAAVAALDSASAGKSPPLGLYIHIPFCRKRCHFCYFRVYTDRNSSDVDLYLRALAKEAELYSHRAGLLERQFDFVYFGGGTPSFLSNEQLERLIARIREHWRWENAREVTFECEPGTLKKSKLEAIRRIGVTRLSLGVEHFDDEILALGNRAHRSAEVFEAYQWARDVGFPQINVDLIAGMLGETDDKWRRTVERTIGLSPDSVTIYQMEIPHNTTVARDSKQSGGDVPIAGWGQKRAWVDYAFREFEAAGYGISSAYTLVKKESKQGFVYRDALWHGADLIGTGVASFSHFAGVHFQNVDTWEAYVGALLERGELPIGRALPTTDIQRLTREMILQLKLGRLDAGYFTQKFGIDVLNRFEKVWRDLGAEGMARTQADRVELTRDGLLRVDALLPRFYESAYRDVRYT